MLGDFIISSLDYCNKESPNLYPCFCHCSLMKSVLNSAACTTLLNWLDLITPLCRSILWRLSSFTVKKTVLTMAYRTLYGLTIHTITPVLTFDFIS